MAVIRAFRHEVKGFGTRHSTDVDCLYFDFHDAGGKQILQLSTLGSEHRQSKPKVSQTFQIGREGAAQLRSILEETFAGIAGEQAEVSSSRALDAAPNAANLVEPADALERFAARAGLTRLRDVDLGESTARRRTVAHDDRPLIGGAWYLVDFTNLDLLTYRDVERDLRTAPRAYQRMAVIVVDLSEDLRQHLEGIHADVVRAQDLGLPSSSDVVPRPEVGARTARPGTRQSLVPDLQFMCETLGVVLSTPDDAWPGHGKAVYLHGGGTAYVNRSSIEVRATPQQVAVWARAGHGTVRGPHGQYLRMPIGPAARSAATVPRGVDRVWIAPAPVSSPSPAPRTVAAGSAPMRHLAASFPWLEQLFDAELYAEQKGLAGRATVSDDVVRDVLTALIRLGLSGPIESVEHDAGLSGGELRRIVPLLRRLLNVDGYETLSFGDGILVLDDDLLRQQFGLTRAHHDEGEA